jgi:hypothetical protein
MTDAQCMRQTGDYRCVAGRYELVALNGSLLPTEMRENALEQGLELQTFLIEGELELAPDGTYALRFTARYDITAGASYTKEHDSTGTWRFVASALDETSGEIAIVSANGRTTYAAVTRLSLVHRTPSEWGRREAETTWVYIRLTPG